MNTNKVTSEMVETILGLSKFEDLKYGEKTTVVMVTLPNGFVIVESSSCVDPANYDHEVGKKICKARITEKIWELQGYLCQSVGNSENLTDVIARVCHEANRAYCKTIGDNSQDSWQFAPGWQKDSAINGVKFIIDHPNASPLASHYSWMEEKLKNGWKYGPLKDAEKKEHPCIVPYEHLPVEQKAKDYIFSAIVRAMLPARAQV